MAARRRKLVRLAPWVVVSCSGLNVIPWRKELKKVAVAGALAAELCLLQHQPAQGLTQPVEAQQSVEEVWDVLNKYYYDGTQLSKPEWLDARGALGSLARDAPEKASGLREKMVRQLGGDRFTRLVDERAYEALSRYDILGIGLILAPGDDGIAKVVSPPLPGSSAAKAGIRVDEIIQKIDGVSTKGLSSFDYLDIVEKDPRPLVDVALPDREVALPRTVSRIEDPLGSVEVTSSKTGYVRIREFNARAGDRLGEALENLRAQGAEALILDLRGNPGGAFQSAVDAASLFLDTGVPVVQVLEKTLLPAMFQAKASTKTELPVEIWIDKNSASASEVFAGALRDNCKAVIAGDEPSYGKGKIQAVFGLKHAPGGLVVTVAQYLTPNGTPIQGIGVKPDVPLSGSIPFSAIVQKIPDPPQILQDFQSTASLCIAKQKM